MSNKRNQSGSGGVQSVDRAAYVLEILAHRGEAGVSQVAADIGVHKTTAFRLLSALEGRELVEQSRERGKYRLGLGILRLASAVPGRLDIADQSRRICEELAAHVGETVNIAVRRSHFVVNIDQTLGPNAIAAHNWVGELTPLHATSSGKVLLADMTPDERHEALAGGQLVHLTARTVISRRELDAQVDEAARNGFATCIGELEDGLNAVAAPVRDYTGRVIAALSISGPVYRLTEERLRDVAADVVASATSISRRMGHRD